mmetsp:Transcript_5603/g.15191  ORF Transcript_5603/g.15191 Transcript_5603/m.15191 type:complete len:210 (+) Transcript_5603:528-1157(+)
MSVIAKWGRGESDRFVHLREGALEVSHQAMEEVVAGCFDFERRLEGEIVLGAGKDVQMEDGNCVRDHRCGQDNINDRFLDSDLLDRCHVETVHVIPEVDPLLLDLTVFDAAYVHDCLVGEDHAVLDEPFVAGEQDGVEHRFVEQEVAHPFADDDVNVINGKLYLLDLSLDDFDVLGKSVDPHDLSSLIGDGGAVDGEHLLGSSLRSEHG